MQHVCDVRSYKGQPCCEWHCHSRICEFCLSITVQERKAYAGRRIHAVGARLELLGNAR